MSVTKVEVKFRPVDRDTLKLIHTTYQQEGDAAANYGRLMSAAMVAGAIIGLTKEQIAQHAEVCAEHAIRAVETRTDIFGGKSSNENH